MIARYAADDDRMSWGRVVRARHLVTRPRFGDEIAAALADATKQGRNVLAVGLGRSYGDSNLNPDGALIDTTGLDRIVAFDSKTGVLRVEAGASLSDILRFSVPRGWFLPTTPGTRFVTIGGAIANDVHGKNHESAGSIGCWVRRIGLVRSDRGALELAADIEPELFAATIGGLGLTGIMAWAEVQLVRIPSSFIDEEVIPFENLDDFLALAAESTTGFEHIVSWIDCTGKGRQLGRGLFTRGNWASDGGLVAHDEAVKLNVPIDGAAIAFSQPGLRVLNAAYRASFSLRSPSRRVHYASHLYPLDSVGSWNRLYGRGGLYQYQCVVPTDAGKDAVAALLGAIAADGAGSTLAVLKTFGGKRSPGLLSFPAPGLTLAMDFRNAGAATLRLLARLDEIVQNAGGRLYPAKDGRMPAQMFQSSFPNWRQFAAHVDPALSSAFWRRVAQ